MSGDPTVRPEIVEPLRRVLRWMLSLRDAQGRIVCPEHRIEHTGKSAGAAVLAAELSRLCTGTGEAGELREVALQQGRRLVARLEREGESDCHTFRPGMHDPFNCSNNIIDGGACSDALATLVSCFGAEMGAAEREAFSAASRLHARTYLRYAVLDKGMPAQRAWGLTGLAAAHALDPDPDLERAALEAVGALEGIQHEDGSYPYQPEVWSEGGPTSAAVRGASDVSAFYQSRVTAFLMFALEALGRRPADSLFRGPIQRGLEFVCALQGPDGIKCGLVEAKPWYFGAHHEVASHPFDVYALARGAALLDRAAFGAAATRAFFAWVDHLGADGRPASHRPGSGGGRSFQCPLFWASHASWAARAAGDLERILAREVEPEPTAAGSLELSVTFFQRANLARLEDGRVVAWVRGARPGSNLHHGSPVGAGLLRAVRKDAEAGFPELIERGGELEGEWEGRAGRASLARGWRSGGSELPFSAWLARTHLRGGRPLAALATPFRVFRRGVLAYGSSTVGSAWDLAPSLEVLPDGIGLRSALAHRDGTPAAGSRIERTYRVDGEGLCVAERLVAAGAARGVSYRVPRQALAVERSAGEVRYRLA